MNTKGTRPDVGASERAEMGAGLDRSTTSMPNPTTPTAVGQAFRVADLLSRGAENALPLKHLKGLLHADGRTVRRQIEVERRRGIPILSNCRDGYFLPDSDSEKAQCVRSMRGRAAEILKTAAAIEAGGNETE